PHVIIIVPSPTLHLFPLSLPFPFSILADQQRPEWGSAPTSDGRAGSVQRRTPTSEGRAGSVQRRTPTSGGSGVQRREAAGHGELPRGAAASYTPTVGPSCDCGAPCGGVRWGLSKLRLRPRPTPPNLQPNPPSPLSAGRSGSELEVIPAAGGEVEAAPALLIQASPPLCIDRGWKERQML
ncbi:unnamed protein product, partial [Urochloa humidicola]